MLELMQILAGGGRYDSLHRGGGVDGSHPIEPAKPVEVARVRHVRQLLGKPGKHVHEDDGHKLVRILERADGDTSEEPLVRDVERVNHKDIGIGGLGLRGDDIHNELHVDALGAVAQAVVA